MPLLQASKELKDSKEKLNRLIEKAKKQVTCLWDNYISRLWVIDENVFDIYAGDIR